MTEDEFYTHCLLKFGAPESTSVSTFWSEATNVYGVGHRRSPRGISYFGWVHWFEKHHDQE